uniref:Uncharacterized protein n=1 Tax=Romanomermis culicivorax TaxID=13658 RepID=A0A915ISU0_ROMCU
IFGPGSRSPAPSKRVIAISTGVSLNLDPFEPGLVIRAAAYGPLGAYCGRIKTAGQRSTGMAHDNNTKNNNI